MYCKTYKIYKGYKCTCFIKMPNSIKIKDSNLRAQLFYNNFENNRNF